MKKSITKKIFIKICKLLGFEIIDQNEFFSPTLNKSLTGDLSNDENVSFRKPSLPKVNNFGKLVTERIKGFLKDDDLTEFKDENL